MIRALYVPPGPPTRRTLRRRPTWRRRAGDSARTVKGGRARLEARSRRRARGARRPGVAGDRSTATSAGSPTSRSASAQNCVFNRVLQNGIESMAATLAERKGLTLDHSREWLRYVGLERDDREPRGRARDHRGGARGARLRRAPDRGRGPALDRVLPHDRARRPSRRGDRDGRSRHRDRGPRILLRDTSSACRSQPRSMGQVDVKPGRARRRRGGRADGRDRPRARRGAGVRPINLIPLEQRRGAARGPPARAPASASTRCSACSASPCCACSRFVMTSNSINTQDREARQGAGAGAGRRSRSPTRCVPTASSRTSSRRATSRSPSLASGRFDWERALRQLSLAIPENV